MTSSVTQISRFPQNRSQVKASSGRTDQAGNNFRKSQAHPRGHKFYKYTHSDASCPARFHIIHRSIARTCLYRLCLSLLLVLVPITRTCLASCIRGNPHNSNPHHSNLHHRPPQTRAFVHFLVMAIVSQHFLRHAQVPKGPTHPCWERLWTHVLNVGPVP